MRIKNTSLVGLAMSLVVAFGAWPEVAGAAIVVHSITPSSGSSAGATEVNVIGQGFKFDSTVSFGDVSATVVHYGSSGELTVTSPALGAGTLNDVTIHNANESATLPKAWLSDFMDVPGG